MTQSAALGDSVSYLKNRSALTVYQALVFRLVRQERDTWGHLAQPGCRADGGGMAAEVDR